MTTPATMTDAQAQREAFVSTQMALLEKIRLADRAGASALLDRWIQQHPRESLLPEILEPVLLRIGEEWRTRQAYTLAQAYVAAKVAEDALTRLATNTPQNLDSQPHPGPVILGNIEDDFHGLGRRMVVTFLRTHGWQVEDLGNDVPAGDFIDAAVRMQARVIGVSAMMLSTARNIRKVREEIDRQGFKGRIQLAVGGAVFLVKPELVAEVGGDGCASNAMGAVRLFEDLWAKSLNPLS
jgi:methanogenic corrinoid protein MtbC1